MRTVRIISWALVAALTVVLAYLLIEGFRQAEEGGDLAFGGPFQLVDTQGQPFTEADLEGRPYAIFFGFTHCPDVCPTTLAEMNGWIVRLGEKADDMAFVFVTVDPERDTPEVLGSYISSFDARITGLSGEPEKVAEMLKAYKIYSKKVPLDGGGYTMDHTASVLLIDGQGDFAGTIAYGENPDAAFAKLERLANGAS